MKKNPITDLPAMPIKNEKTSTVDIHATPLPVKNEKIEPIVNNTTTSTSTSNVATPTASPTASPMATTTTAQDESDTLNTKAKIYIFKGLFKKSWHLENEANITVTKTELSFMLSRNEKKSLFLSEIKNTKAGTDWVNSVEIELKQNTADANKMNKMIMFQFGDRDTANKWETRFNTGKKCISYKATHYTKGDSLERK